MKILSAVLALAVSLAIVGNLSAEEKKKDKRPDRPMMGMMRMFEGLDFSEEQQAKFKELRKEYLPKLKTVGEKLRDILTEEQKTARAEARKAALEAGKKGKEVRDAVQDAVKLTDEQKAKFVELRKEKQALRKEMREKGAEILTPEQKEILKMKRALRKKMREKGIETLTPEQREILKKKYESWKKHQAEEK